MPNIGNVILIKQLKEIVEKLDHRCRNHRFYAYMEFEGNVSENTIRRAEAGEEGCNADSFKGIALGFSNKLIELYGKHAHTAIFNDLKTPRLGWLIERLERGEENPIKPEELIVNHEERYLIDQYRINLAVRPCLNRTEDIPRAGQPPEPFAYNDLAIVTYDLTFSPKNQREEPGFKLAYGTHNGRIKLLEPDESLLTEDKAYRLHKRNAVFEPSPCVSASHRLRLAVYGGYAEGSETAHFSMAQQAYYQNVSFTLDLSAYPDEGFGDKPELIVIPVLEGKKLDCCNIARNGQGFPVDPDKGWPQAGEWRWTFSGLMRVLICVRWKIKHEQLGSAGTPTEGQIIDFYNKKVLY